ncbi:ribosomal RNA methyltransferase Nop2 [Tremella mesenterica]|uniref:Nucleolar protein 2 n=1 Tax=Tremella mesenterica TaxID=5217 RepID=A0A4Q1BRR7_TREME|nr:ribosomal RNA methyltransferase Nop2 [Tremella mesenterica]
MGRKAKNKQAAPTPLVGSDLDRRRDKGKRKAPSGSDNRKSLKAAKGVNAKSSKDRQRRLQPRVKKVDVVDDDDSDIEDALRPGELSDDQEEIPVKKVKKGKKPATTGSDEDDLPSRPIKQIEFSDSEDDTGGDDERLPPGQHTFDLDEAPEDDGDFDSQEEDDFDLVSDEEMNSDEDSAFASSGAEEDVDMDENDLPPPHLRPNPIPTDEEGGPISTNLEDDLDHQGFTLPAVERGGEQEDYEAGTSLKEVESRMRWLIGVCSGKQEKTSNGLPGRSRSDHLLQLQHDIATYFGYNLFLVNKLMKLFIVDEAIAFFEANESPRPVTIRANTLRTRRRDLAQTLSNRGVVLEPIGKWSKVGLQVFESPVPVGATPEYLAGHYMLQSASSFLPVIALAPQPEERILDMASAPGGKTTYISALMQNTGIVFANDSNKQRTKSLTANVHRLGCKNVVVCNYDAREFPKVLGGFDRVLLDAPCSGTGVISKDQSVKVNKTERDFQLLAHLQKQLLLCALDSVNPNSTTGGYVVYSTCSVTVDENEAVVDYALRKRPHCKLVDTGLEFGVEGFKAFEGKTFHDNLSLTRRYYPHKHNMDGFFVAKFKIGKRAKKETEKEEEPQRMINAEGEVVIQPSNVTMFNAEEDEQLIKESKRKHLKSKGIKLSKPRSDAHTTSTAVKTR